MLHAARAAPANSAHPRTRLTTPSLPPSLPVPAQLNIFTGLIASAFEAIRDDKNTIETDSQSKCLVCSLDMYTFDENIPGGFEEHVSMQHDPLQYVFFLHHLRSTSPTDYTGLESAVVTVLNSTTTSTEKGTWLPVSKSLALRTVLDARKREGKE